MMVDQDQDCECDQDYLIESKLRIIFNDRVLGMCTFLTKKFRDSVATLLSKSFDDFELFTPWCEWFGTIFSLVLA